MNNICTKFIQNGTRTKKYSRILSSSHSCPWSVSIKSRRMLFNVNHVMKRIPKRGSHEVVDRKVDGCIKDLKKLDKGRYVHKPCRNS